MDTMTQMVELAQKFLQESVFASREASHGFSPRALDGASGCGLGLRPAIPDDFNEKQAALLEQMLSAAGRDAVPFEDVRAHAARWIKIQDGLDRTRNHFLKDFRNTHGFDRKSYGPEVEAEYKAGLSDINEGNRAELEAHARDLASLFDSPSR